MRRARAYRLLTDESGIAVLTVLMAMALILILGGALILTATAAMERSVAATDSTRALDTAEAGLQTAAQTVIAAGFIPGQTGSVTGTLDDGSQYSVDWTANAALRWFTLVSTGQYPNSTKPLGTRKITAQSFSLNPWDFFYAGGMSGATVNGNVWVQGPFYVNDNLRLSGTAGIHGGPLILFDTSGPGNADLILDSNSADIGSPGNNVALFIDGRVIMQQNPNSYYASPVYSSAPKIEYPDLTAADLQLYRWDYTVNGTNPWLALGEIERPNAVWDADAGPTTDFDTPLLFSKTSMPVDTDPKFRFSGEGKKVWWTRDANGDVTISFNNTGGTRPVLFVDGDLSFDASKINIRYQGVGTIVASGRIDIKGSLVPVGSTMTNDLSTSTLTGFPDANGLGLITLNNFHFDGTNTEWLAAAVYAGGTASFSHQGRFKGAVVTRLFDLGNNVPHLYGEPGFSMKLPPRMPGANTRVNTLVGWSEETP